MKSIVHAIAGITGFLCISIFWVSTAFSELFLSHESVALVKSLILQGMFILVPAMAVAGGSGMAIGAKWKSPAALAKKKRMPVIAFNGLCILLPSAYFLAQKSNANEFDTWFYTVQVLELGVGAINLSLMGLNIRDGLKLKGRLKP